MQYTVRNIKMQVFIFLWLQKLMFIFCKFPKAFGCQLIIYDVLLWQDGTLDNKPTCGSEVFLMS